MRKNPLRTRSENDYAGAKEKIYNKYPKVTFNLLDKSNNQEFDTKMKSTILSSNLRAFKFPKKVNSFLNLKNNLKKEPKKLLKKLTKANEIDGVPVSKSSLNIKNSLATKTFEEKEIIAKTKSYYYSNTNNNNNNNNNVNPNQKSKLEQTKNNFLTLITRINEDNYEREDSNAKYPFLHNNNFVNIEEEDSLDKVEKKLQDKILDMEKEFEFMEFEIESSGISLDKSNIKKRKKKIINKKTKDLERKKSVKNKKFMTTDIRKKKNMLSQITSTNSNNANSDNVLFNKIHPNYNLDDSAKLFLNEKKKVNNHMNFLRKLKLGTTNIKQSKINNLKKTQLNKEKDSTNIESTNKKSNNNSLNAHDKYTSIFKTNHPKFFPKKSTVLTKSKTYSNIESKIGQSFIDTVDSYDKINSLSSDKDIIFIDKEKFRILIHKKLVYDSLDDEELMEDAVIDNFYFMPNSTFIIIIDTLILIFTFCIMLYKPLYLVLNNCDVKNTITSITFDNFVNIFIDILFICDLIVNFFKAYYNFEEQLITKSNLIFCHYLKGYFIMDFISAIPYYSIIKLIAFNRYRKYGINPSCSEYYNHQINDSFQILELLKLIKVIKCASKSNIVTNYITNTLNAVTFFENWSYLIFNICLFFLLLHLTACIHIFISCTTMPNWIILNDFNMSSFPTIYLASIYFLITTVTSVGYGDITGNTFTEFCFQIVILLVGIIAYSWLISSLSNYVKENNQQNEIFSKKLSILNEINLEHPNMPKELYDKIYLHLEYVNLKQKKDKSSLIDSLPHTVKKSLLCEMYKPIIDNFNFFKNFKNSEFINKVISKLKPIIGVKNDLLIEQGEIIEETFFVKQGRLSLEVKIDINSPEKSVQKLLDEEYFFGVENNELYQQNAFNLSDMGVVKQKVDINAINKNSLFNLDPKNTIYINNMNQKDIKSVLTDDQGKGEIQKQQKYNSNYIYLKILDIRKNEHFGALLMFLNKRSPLSLRVKTKKAELFFLKKIDAIEISSSYSNIWKRANRASIHNLKQIKKIMHKIIIHYCETYGINFMNKIGEGSNIKDLNDLKRFYTIQKQLTKEYENNNFTVLKNKYKQKNLKSVLASKSQLKMLKEYINYNTMNSNMFIEKKIAQPEVKDLDIENNINRETNKTITESENSDTSFEHEDQLNCTLNAIKEENQNKLNEQENSFSKADIKKYSENKNSNNTIKSEESKESKESKTNNEFYLNDKNKIKKDEKSLTQNSGTQYNEEDLYDGTYNNENQAKNSKSNNNVEELEYTPVNYILSTKGSMKNNYIQTINELKINDDKKNNNNFFISNNYITNNVINNIQSKNNKNELMISHFNFNLKIKKEKQSSLSKPKNVVNKIYNLEIYKNSFELFGLKKEDKKSLNIDNKRDNFSSNDSSFDSSSSDSNEKNNKKIGKLSSKKINNSSSDSELSIKQNVIKDKNFQISKTKRFRLNAEYFNLNKITKGRFSKNYNFQNYIKNIILEKISDLTHSRIELPRVKEHLRSKVSNSALPVNKKKITKKLTAFLPLHNIRNDTFKFSFQRSNLKMTELKDKGKENNTGKKKINKKSNKNVPLLHYINRNIRDDSAVLNNPGQFYNGLFNNLMRRYTKANFK